MQLVAYPIKKLHEFVKKICEDRDESHGYDHANHVAICSLYIFMNIFGEINNNNVYILNTVMVVAYTHDIPDHKYDHAGKLAQKLMKFLEEIFVLENEEINFIMNIINKISYSKEKKYGSSEWYQQLGSIGCLVRDIVSDADKLCALGKKGLDRCIEYTKAMYREKYDKEIPYDQMVTEVKQHAEDKLSKLKDEYIRTVPGKIAANKLHEEFIECMNKL